ncbi:MAG: YheV family putative metal-binding protein [Gammaproteobacteria bacterium]|nr:YheV family putative metal-binding protein [Gammaproteobacteria bacterium]
MKVRFIAGIVCPKCGSQDSVRIHIAQEGEVDEQLRDCVTCGHEERIGQGAAARKEVPTRVNHSDAAAVQEVEPQVLKLK